MIKQLFAGIDIGATNVKFGLVDADGDIAFRDQTSTPQEDSAEKLFDKIVLCGERLLVEADELEGEVRRIGVGSPGAVDMVTGTILGPCPNIPFWVGFHLRNRLEERLNLPIFVDNDANCAAVAEHRFGAGKGYKNVICLTIGTGIGGGLILNGRLYRGTDFSAGEIGHMVIPDSGEQAGKTHILESIVSAPAIVARVRERLADQVTPVFQSLTRNDQDNLTIRKVFTAIRKGDRMAPEVLQEKARILGIALASLVNVLDPEIIVLGGGVVEGGAAFVDIVRDTIMAAALPVATKSLKVTPARLGNAAGFIGAALLGSDESAAS
jgi:glucokinase